LGEDGPVTLEHIGQERILMLAQLTEERDELLVIGHEDLEDRADKIKNMIALSVKKRAALMDAHRTSIQRVADLKSAISRRQSGIAGFREAIEKNTQLQHKITEADNNILVSQHRVDELDKDIELYETISGLFGTTGAPAYVLDSAVDVFNEKVGAYASLIWPNASYTLQSFKENKSGDVKAKFSEKLVINGKDRSIGALSGGEHRCLSLAVDFAVIDVLETMFGISMNPIMLDEPFNDLDASNRERVLELLDKISTNRQILVIDHASEAKAMFSNTIRVEKRSGISSLV
jgi:DNA repair exonuclease SbcCD ATPase subunit